MECRLCVLNHQGFQTRLAVTGNSVLRTHKGCRPSTFPQQLNNTFLKPHPQGTFLLFKLVTCKMLLKVLPARSSPEVCLSPTHPVLALIKPRNSHFSNYRIAPFLAHTTPNTREAEEEGFSGQSKPTHMASPRPACATQPSLSPKR